MFCLKSFILRPALCGKNRRQRFSPVRKVMFSSQPQIQNSLSQVYPVEDPFFFFTSSAPFVILMYKSKVV